MGMFFAQSGQRVVKKGEWEFCTLLQLFLYVYDYLKT